MSRRNHATRISYSFPVVAAIHRAGGLTLYRSVDRAELQPDARTEVRQADLVDRVWTTSRLTTCCSMASMRAAIALAACSRTRRSTIARSSRSRSTTSSRHEDDASAARLPGTFNVATFYNDFSDQQLQFGFDARVDPLTGATAPVSPTTAIINAGKSRIYGAEVEAVDPAGWKGLRFELSYTYLKAEIREIQAVSTADPNYQPQTSQIAKGSAAGAVAGEQVRALGQLHAAAAGEHRSHQLRRHVRAHRRAADDLCVSGPGDARARTARTTARSIVATCSA